MWLLVDCMMVKQEIACGGGSSKKLWWQTMLRLSLPPKLAGFEKDPLQTARLHKESLVDPKLNKRAKIYDLPWMWLDKLGVDLSH